MDEGARFGPERVQLLAKALEESDPEDEEREDDVARRRREVSDLAQRVRRQVANLEMVEPGSEAASAIRQRLKELAAAKARKERELEAAEGATLERADPDAARQIVDVLPLLELHAETLADESFRELLQALDFEVRFDQKSKELRVRVVLAPDLLNGDARVWSSPLPLVPPTGQYPKKYPQVDGLPIALSKRHAKIRRDGYQRRAT